MYLPHQEVTGPGQLLVLVHPDDSAFRLAATRVPEKRRSMLSAPGVDVDLSHIAAFSDFATAERMVLALRKLVERVALQKTGRRSYPLTSLGTVLDALKAESSELEFLGGARTFAPLDEAEAKTFFEAEDAKYAVRMERQRVVNAQIDALRHQQQEARNAAYYRQQAEEAQERAHARQAALNAFAAKRLRDADWVNAQAPSPGVMGVIEVALARLDAACNGYLSLKSDLKGKMLEGWALKSTPSLKGAVDCLKRQVVHDGCLEQDVDGNYPCLESLFRVYDPEPPRLRSSAKRFHVRVAVSLKHLPLLMTLRPGIRGWDLPLESAHRLYDPARKSSVLAPEATMADEVFALWSQALLSAPSSIRDLLQPMQLSGLSWNPPAIRYVARSPFPEDSGAPLMLARLSQGAGPTGVESTNLLTGTSTPRAFQGQVAEQSSISIWSAKECTLVATNLADAVAIQSHTRFPVVVVRSPEALAALQLLSMVEETAVFLAEPDDGAWQDAAGLFAERCRQTGVNCGTFGAPLQEGEAPSTHPWADLLGRDRNLKRKVEVDLTSCASLSSVLG